MKNTVFHYHSHTLEQTNLLGAQLSQACQVPFVLYLQGHLGVGKTTFVRAFLRQMGVRDRIKSPTYALIEPYEFDDKAVYHIDLYRLEQPTDINALGLQDYLLAMDSILLIEWPDKGGALTPKADLVCHIQHTDDENARLFDFTAHTTAGQQVLSTLSAFMKRCDI